MSSSASAVAAGAPLLGQQAGVLERDGGVGRQQLHLAHRQSRELVQPQLREHEHARGTAVVHERHREDRLVDVVGPRDLSCERALARVGDVERLAASGGRTGDALADRDAQTLERLVLVLVDRPAERDRLERRAVVVEDVHPGVVVVDHRLRGRRRSSRRSGAMSFSRLSFPASPPRSRSCFSDSTCTGPPDP